MPEPILATQNTWWAPNVSSITAPSITEIEIMDSYTPTGTVADSWDASEAKDGSVTCYVIGTKLIIAGNGSGKVYANVDSSNLFNPGDSFVNVITLAGIEHLDTSRTTNFFAFFSNFKSVKSLDLRTFDVSKVQFFCQMFENSPNLKRIKGLDKWNTSAGLGFDGMFERCSALEELDLSSFNTTKAKNGVSASSNGHKTLTLNNMFLSCDNLEKVTVGANFSVNGDGTNTKAANKAILPTPSSTYIPGADGNWYTFNGDKYAPNAMKDRTAATYYASFDMVADADVIVKNGSLIDTAKAIREKNGTTTQYTPSEFGAAIRALT